ncbi:MAG: endonuclease [Cytophagia bacterium]|nr:MAG: endonuclease [Cytophagia bacterium]
MKENNLNINDFVITLVAIENVEKNSVGLILEITTEEIVVFFIGKKIIIPTIKEKISFLDVNLTGKPYQIKICNVCHVLKNETEFDINQTDAKGRKTTRPSCKTCRIEIDGKSLIKEDSAKMDKIKPDKLFICPICQKTSIVGITANLVKDHNHITGSGREWICDSCNTGLGRFKDNIEILERAINYLHKYNE